MPAPGALAGQQGGREQDGFQAVLEAEQANQEQGQGAAGRKSLQNRGQAGAPCKARAPSGQGGQREDKGGA